MSGIILQCWKSYYFGRRLSGRQLFHIWFCCLSSCQAVSHTPVAVSEKEKVQNILPTKLFLFWQIWEVFTRKLYTGIQRFSMGFSRKNELSYFWLAQVFLSLLSHLPSHLIILFSPSLLDCCFLFTNKIYSISPPKWCPLSLSLYLTSLDLQIVGYHLFNS